MVEREHDQQHDQQRGEGPGGSVGGSVGGGGRDWRSRAVCRDEDPELFFPVGTAGPALAQVAEAKSVCRRCPVTGACLAWAVDSGQYTGVWGGTSAGERHELARRDARPRGRVAVPVGATKRERTAAGRAAVASGEARESVMERFGVSDRTVLRWAVEARALAAEDDVPAPVAARSVDGFVDDSAGAAVGDVLEDAGDGSAW